MKAWRRNIVIAAVLLLVCTGVYLNWARSRQTVDLTDTLDADVLLGDSTVVMSQDSAAVETAQSTDEVSASEYFSQMRLSRQQARDQAVELLQQTIGYDEAEQGEQSDAVTQLNTLVSDTLAEAQIESLVIAKGYADCVAYMTDGTISVAVAAPQTGLEQTDVAVISDIVSTQSGYPLANVRIIEVK